MIAFCTFCGLVWDSQIFGGKNTNIILSNVATNCPRCNHTVRLDGNYMFDANGIASLMSSTIISPSLYEQLKTLLFKARQEHYTLQQLTQEIEKVSPGFKLNQFLPKNFGDVMLIITFLLGLIELFKKDQPPQIVNNNRQTITVVNNTPSTDAKEVTQKSETKKRKPRPHKKKRKR